MRQRVEFAQKTGGCSKKEVGIARKRMWGTQQQVGFARNQVIPSTTGNSSWIWLMFGAKKCPGFASNLVGRKMGHNR